MKKTATTKATISKNALVKKPVTRAEWIRLFVDKHKTALTILAHK